MINIFLNDAESPFSRRFVEHANSRQINIIAARQETAEDQLSSEFQKAVKFPYYCPWNPSSIFSIRLTLRQSQYLFQNKGPVFYTVFLSSNNSNLPSLQHSPLNEIQNALESEFYGAIMLLREIENKRQEQTKSLEEIYLVLIVLEENEPLGTLSQTIYQGLYSCFKQFLQEASLDPTLFGFYSRSKNYDAYSSFIINYLMSPSNKHIGKWIHFKDSWNPLTISSKKLRK